MRLCFFHSRAPQLGAASLSPPLALRCRSRLPPRTSPVRTSCVSFQLLPPCCWCAKAFAWVAVPHFYLGTHGAPPPPPQTNNALPEILVALNLPCASRMQVPEEPQKVKILIKGVVRRKYPLHDQLHTRCAQILYGSEALTTIPLHSNLGLTLCGTRETGHGTRDTDTGQGAGDTGRETGLGTRDTGQGKQDTGHGTQNTGHRTQDARRDTGHGTRPVTPRPVMPALAGGPIQSHLPLTHETATNK